MVRPTPLTAAVLLFLTSLVSGAPIEARSPEAEAVHIHLNIDEESAGMERGDLPPQLLHNHPSHTHPDEESPVRQLYFPLSLAVADSPSHQLYPAGWQSVADSPDHQFHTIPDTPAIGNEGSPTRERYRPLHLSGGATRQLYQSINGGAIIDSDGNQYRLTASHTTPDVESPVQELYSFPTGPQVVDPQGQHYRLVPSHTNPEEGSPVQELYSFPTGPQVVEPQGQRYHLVAPARQLYRPPNFF